MHLAIPSSDRMNDIYILSVLSWFFNFVLLAMTSACEEVQSYLQKYFRTDSRACDFRLVVWAYS